jgi:hypothetical protein
VKEWLSSQDRTAPPQRDADFTKKSRRRTGFLSSRTNNAIAEQTLYSTGNTLSVNDFRKFDVVRGMRLSPKLHRRIERKNTSSGKQKAAHEANVFKRKHPAHERPPKI